MRSYNPADWASFFTALISAAAALTGLLFVAVSINLDRILKGGRFLPARAAETLAVLLLVVIGSAVTLIPQDTRLIGIEVLSPFPRRPCCTVTSSVAGGRRAGPAAPSLRCRAATGHVVAPEAHAHCGAPPPGRRHNHRLAVAVF
jgi:hypothetical protein